MEQIPVSITVLAILSYSYLCCCSSSCLNSSLYLSCSFIYGFCDFLFLWFRDFTFLWAVALILPYWCHWVFDASSRTPDPSLSPSSPYFYTDHEYVLHFYSNFHIDYSYFDMYSYHRTCADWYRYCKYYLNYVNHQLSVEMNVRVMAIWFHVT